VVLFQSYERRSLPPGFAADPLPRIDIGWNTNLAYIQADAWSDHRATDRDARYRCGWNDQDSSQSPGGRWRRLRISRTHPGRCGSRDSGHCGNPSGLFLQREGLVEGKDYRALRFNCDVGKARRTRYKRG